MFYIVYNEMNSKILITKNESDMFDLIIGDCVLVGTTDKNDDIEDKVAEFWKYKMLEQIVEKVVC